MIVKEKTILQGFPSPSFLKELCSVFTDTEGFSPVFYDIETTGLSRTSSFLYLIGTVRFEKEHWILRQWLGEGPEEEASLLSAFSGFLKGCTHTLQFNGCRFDQPYLEARYQAHGLPAPFGASCPIDVYQRLKTAAPLFKLQHMKQRDLEAFLGHAPRLCCDGKECIRIYRDYLKQKEDRDISVLLGHNEEDLIGLGTVAPMLSYLCLYRGLYSLQSLGYGEDHIYPVLALPFPLPAPVSAGSERFYLTADRQEARLSVPLQDGRLRIYYDNYKEYDYLPDEDTAVPKALSRFMDRSLRIPAGPDTCYTWFPCDEAFLMDTQKQEQYIKRVLPHLLSSLR